MSVYNEIISLCLFCICSVHVARSDISVLFFCDSELGRTCGEIAGSMLPEKLAHGSPSVSINSVLLEPAGDFIENVQLLQNAVIADQSVSLFVGFGDDDLVNAMSTVATETNITTILYTTSYHRKLIYEEHVITIHPDHRGLARAIDSVIGQRMLEKSYVICEDSLDTDGFLDVIGGLGVNSSFRVYMSKTENTSNIRLKLLHIHDIGVRIMIVHATSSLFQRIATVALGLSYFDSGYAWIVTEEVLTDGLLALRSIPTGLLAVVGSEDGKYEGLLISVIRAITEKIKEIYDTAESYNYSQGDVGENFREILSSHQRMRRDLESGIRTSTHLFDANGSRRSMQYKLLNYVKDPYIQDSQWKTVGYVIDNDLNLETVIWPGRSIFGPVSLAREFYTIVTRVAEPFVYIRGPVSSPDSCAVNNVCINIHTEDTYAIKAAVESFRSGEIDDSANYTLYCCEGIVIDILHSLSVDLRFDFLLYFKDDDRYGHFANGSWNGMIGDVYYGAADMLAGAVSITSERMNAVWFTESFYYSSFNMVSSRDRTYTSLWAFTRPFDLVIWLLIIISATTVAIATALYEWNSPFGLNPWGKKRKRNYTLGSALTMVYSLWFGHTVNTKSPKSWPSKVLQNFWAAMAIFITAGYTANLAAFLAGNAYQDSTYSVLDSQITSKKVGVVATSAVEEYTKALNVGLHTRFQRYHVDNIEMGLEKIRSGELDLYMDDTPLLEYALATYDTNCTLKYAAHAFGDNSYAFAMKRGSWLKDKFDPLILNYVELGVVEDLRWRYMGKTRQCETKLMSKDDLGFGLRNTAGLFMMLLIGCGLALLLLSGEYVTFYLVLPRLRKKPPDSIWKKRNFEFFSQRLYRAINSEKVKPPAHALVSKVRQKKFQIQSHIHNRLQRQANSVPAALRSYAFHNFKDMTIADLGRYGAMNGHGGSQDNVYTISGTQIIDEVDPDRVNSRAKFRHSMSSPLLGTGIGAINAQGFVNPIFESDEEENDEVTSDHNNRALSRRSRDTVVVIHDNSNAGETNGAQQSSNKNLNSVDSNCGLCKLKNKRYVTWPSPKTRKKSVKRCQNNYNIHSTYSVREYPTDNKRIVNEISKKKYRTSSSSSLDSYHGNHRLELKDNRLKSDLRHHAMGSLPKSPSVSLDEGAVEALSKDDLLVLWKKSEIELQTKLNKMLHQNNHLRQLVNIAEESRNERGANTQAMAGDQAGIQPAFKCSRL